MCRDDLSDLHHVAHDGAACGQRTCALAVEHQLIHRIALHEDGVELVVDGGQGVIKGQAGRLDAVFQLAVLFAGRGQELDLAALGPGGLNIVLGDPADALGGDVLS